MRGIGRLFGVSRQTLAQWLKKVVSVCAVSVCAALLPQRALHNALFRAQKDDRLELDEVWSFEVWSFVGHKKNRGWLWCVQCKGTRQIVAGMPGQRDIVMAGDVGAKEPFQYKDGLCFADGLEA